MLRYLASKGYVAHEQDGPRYVYFPVAEPSDVSRSALRHLVDTFFRSSPSSAMAALLGMTDQPLSDAEYERLTKMLEQARESSEAK
jgi:predicted transcriptional regulator